MPAGKLEQLRTAMDEFGIHLRTDSRLIRQWVAGTLDWTLPQVVQELLLTHYTYQHTDYESRLGQIVPTLVRHLQVHHGMAREDTWAHVQTYILPAVRCLSWCVHGDVPAQWPWVAADHPPHSTTMTTTSSVSVSVSDEWIVMDGGRDTPLSLAAAAETPA